jgi:hypothetical protein
METPWVIGQLCQLGDFVERSRGGTARPPVLLQHVPGHAVEVARRIVRVNLLALGQSSGHSIDGFVGQIGRGCPPVTLKERDETMPDVLVLTPRALLVPIEAGQQHVERVLGQDPILLERSRSLHADSSDASHGCTHTVSVKRTDL